MRNFLITSAKVADRMFMELTYMDLKTLRRGNRIWVTVGYWDKKGAFGSIACPAWYLPWNRPARKRSKP
jgi:hypothetical protein